MNAFKREGDTNKCSKKSLATSFTELSQNVSLFYNGLVSDICTFAWWVLWKLPPVGGKPPPAVPACWGEGEEAWRGPG